jgi:hypothetical protein
MKRKDILVIQSQFNTGDLITIVEHNRGEDGKSRIVTKTEGKVLDKYPNSLLIGRGKNYSIRESFSYIDIAVFGCIEKVRRSA